MSDRRLFCRRLPATRGIVRFAEEPERWSWVKGGFVVGL